MAHFEKAMIWLTAGLTVLIFTALSLSAGAAFWHRTSIEKSPMTLVEGGLLFYSSLLCLLVWFLEGFKARRDSWVWLYLAALLLALTADEVFMLHETVRDMIFNKNSYQGFLLWKSPGDWIMAVYALPAFAALYLLVARAGLKGPDYALLVAAALLALLTQGFDTLPIGLWKGFTRHLLQYLEEALETLAMLCFWVIVWRKFCRVFSEFYLENQSDGLKEF